MRDRARSKLSIESYPSTQTQGDQHQNIAAAARAEKLPEARRGWPRYVYRAAEPARSVAARAVRQIIDRFCQGSVEELVSGMVDANVLSGSEMDRWKHLSGAAGEEANRCNFFRLNLPSKRC